MRAILTWHSVDESGSPISIPLDMFLRQVEWLASGRVRVVGVEELIELDDEVDAVALTFDDGFANFATLAAPRLRERRLPVTVFVVTGQAGRDNRWHGESPAGIPVLPLLDWDQLGQLQESGVTLGAHTKTHPNLTTLERAALEDEFATSASEMERRLGRRPTGMAYPYGAVDTRVAETAGRTFRWACTTEFRAVGPRDARLLLPRLDAWYFRDTRMFERWGSPGFLAWAWCRRQGRRAGAAVRQLRGA